MKCSVYIAISADGYIAQLDGSVDWLHTAGNMTVDMGAESKVYANDFIQVKYTVDYS